MARSTRSEAHNFWLGCGCAGREPLNFVSSLNFDKETSISLERTVETTQPVRASSAGGGWVAPLLVAATATAIVAPMLFLGNASGHDFVFHVTSWLDAARQWHQGVVYPRWAEWANWGFGEPRFIFYPPASWTIGAALGSVLPWRMAPGAFVWLTLVVAGISMWTLAREWLRGSLAIAAALFYLANPYHLVVVYYRSAYAELLAGALLPLLIWSALGVVRGQFRRAVPLAFVFGAIWLSDVPAAIVATYSLCVILMVGCAARRTARPLAPGAAAMAAGFALAACYILPAAWEQGWVQLAQVVSNEVSPLHNFLFTRSNDPDFVAFNHKVSWVALGIMIAAVLAAILVARLRHNFRELWWIFVALGLTSVALMLPITTFLWRTLPKLQFVQFPWRWTEVLAVVFAFFVAAAIGTTQKRTAWLIGIIVVLGICAAGVAISHDAYWDSEDLATAVQAFRSGHGYEGVDEYTPIGCDRSQLPGNPNDTARPAGVSPAAAPLIAMVDATSGAVVPVQGVTLDIQRWSAERKMFRQDSAAPVTLALRILSYPAWQIDVDGHETQPGAQPDTGQILIPLPAGSHLIAAQFRRTWDRTAGDAISALSGLILLGFAWFLRRRTRAS